MSQRRHQKHSYHLRKCKRGVQPSDSRYGFTISQYHRRQLPTTTCNYYDNYYNYLQLLQQHPAICTYTLSTTQQSTMVQFTTALTLLCFCPITLMNWCSGLKQYGLNLCSHPATSNNSIFEMMEQKHTTQWITYNNKPGCTIRHDNIQVHEGTWGAGRPQLGWCVDGKGKSGNIDDIRWAGLPQRYPRRRTRSWMVSYGITIGTTNSAMWCWWWDQKLIVVCNVALN